MSGRKIINVILVFLFVWSSGAQGGIRERRQGHILYQFKNGANQQDYDQVNRVLSKYKLSHRKKMTQGFELQSTELQLVGPTQELKESRESRESRESLSTLNSASVSEETIAEELIKTGAVAFAEPDYLVKPAALPFSDPLLPNQWHHTKIHSFDAWRVTAGNKATVVTVCDSGVDSTHSDLKANLILPGYNVVDGSTQTQPVNLHGTAVTGLIAARAGNGIGIVGVSYNVRILPVRVSNRSDGSAYLSDLSKCIRYGADRGAKVHNVSYTGANSPTIEAAAQYARSKGSLLFMAAGNQTMDISSLIPNPVSFVIVGATTSLDQKSSFSNYGTPISVVAPGSSVWTTIPGNQYAALSGTSFSSPITAAVGALIFSINSRFSPTDVEKILFQSADYIGSSYYFGHGRINAEAAVELARRWTPGS